MKKCNHKDPPILKNLLYVEWHNTVKKLGETHKQIKCKKCGLWAIWKKK